jgi:4-hydroxybenzoate polyprenyltransferase
MKNATFYSRFSIYLTERFPLQQFIPLSLIFGINASLFAQLFLPGSYQILSVLLTSSALFLFLFRLRLFDEFKDYEHDKKHYSSRPVSRGLISLGELRLIILVSLFFELILSLSLGLAPFTVFIIALSYSLLLFKEFFVRDWLRNHFTIYIVVHEVLAIPLFFYLYAMNQREFAFIFNENFWIHSILLALSFFILEVGRKIRPAKLEIASKDTYTAQYGIGGASKLLTGLTVLSLLLAVLIYFKIETLAFITLLPALVSLLYLSVVLSRFQSNPNVKTSKQVFFSAIIYTVTLNIGMIFALWVKG